MDNWWTKYTNRKDWFRDGYPCSQEKWDFLDWSKAWMDMGPSTAGNLGPYWHVPDRDGDCTHRMYPKVLQTKWAPIIWKAISEASVNDQRQALKFVSQWQRNVESKEDGQS